jgi:hypothetical protein
MNSLNWKKSYWLVGMLPLLGLPGFLRAGQMVMPVSYDLKVSLEPGRGNISVHATVEIPLENPQSRDFKFALHETFTIKQLLVNGKKSSFSSQAREPSPLVPASKNVVVSLPPGITQERIRMDIEYEGWLKNIPEFGTFPDQKQAMDDQVNSRLVELSGYSSWYPQFVFGQPLQVELQLSLPQGWTSICSGKKLADRVSEGRAVTHWSSPRDIDILILASPSYREKSVRQSGVDIEIYYTQMPEAFIEREVQQIAGVIKLYTNSLGETNIPAGTVKHVYSPKRKGQGMAGFARPGMIVTSEGRTLDSLAKDPQFSLFQGIAHEIAHFWWNFGSGQGDWINESFSEYFSSLAVQKISSEEEFKRLLEKDRKGVRELPADAPSLATVPLLNDKVGFVVRYYKGALMLNDLREALGEEKFLQACRGFFQAYKGKTIGTAEFRSFWKEKLVGRGRLVDVWLDSRGGLPGLEAKI